jgi:predicted molibdopterin-dependent oxidoreductase YjgC
MSRSQEASLIEHETIEHETLTIDGRTVAIEPGDTILEAAARAGIAIPTLCHDPRLEPAGACRICLVEVEGARRMQAACAAPAEAGMAVRTDSEKVARSQRAVLALLRADTVAADVSRADVVPSALDALEARYGAGPELPALSVARAERVHDDNRFIAFRADRCILCAKCVRYCDEIEGVSAIALADMGAHTTIATVDARSLPETSCELCGGCVSVCPTGAMVDKHALAHGASESDLEPVRTTCNYCGVGCQLDLHVDRAAERVVKVTAPAPGTTVNDGNLCVKGRFAFDFVHHDERLTTPLVRAASGELVPASWDEALDRAAQGLLDVARRRGPDALAFVSSSRCTGEENYLVQKMARAGFATHNVHQCAAT